MSVWSFVAPLLAAAMTLPSAAPSPRDPNDAGDAHKAVARAAAVLENATTTAQLAVRRYEATTAQLPVAQAKVATAKGMVAAARASSAAAGKKADDARAAYGKVAKEYDAAQDDLDAAHDQVDKIAQVSYMGSDFAQFNMLTEASGPADALDRLALIDQVMRSQQRDVDHYTDAQRTARTAQDRAGLAKTQAEDAERDAKDRLAEATTAQADAVKAQLALRDLILQRIAAVRVAGSQRAVVLARYQAAKVEEARIQAALHGFSLKAGHARYGGGQLLMPVHGWKSSDFGERYDPYYHVWQLHAGTDIAAPGGTPIHAAAAGRVIRAGWSGGYGRYTCIDHGKENGTDFTTCYGHQSAFLVHVGEYVLRGQAIGRVGSTGAATGDHLHFETRFDGVPKNPLRYLPGCLC